MPAVRTGRQRLTFAIFRALAAALVAAALVAGADRPVLARDGDTRLASVTVAPATRGEVVGRIPISGTLVPVNEVLVYPEITGITIESLLADVGDRVEQGMVIARLDDRTLTSQLAQAQAEYARAEAAIGQAQSQIDAAEASATQANTALERLQRLLASGTTTQSVLDQAIATAQTADASLASAKDGLSVAEAQLLQARAALDIAEYNFEGATIRAPVSGIVSARNGQIGAISSSAGEPIFRIIEAGAIELEAEIIETALGNVDAGDPVDMEIAGIGPVTGVVRRLSPIVNPRNRLGTARITVTEDRPLRSGLFASGWIVTDRRVSVVVPVTAVLTDQGGTFVLISNDGTLERRPVTAGLIWEGRRELVRGVAPDELVVAKAGAFFADGDRINPVRAEGPAQ